jgi:hypothetical protein
VGLHSIDFNITGVGNICKVKLSLYLTNYALRHEGVGGVDV